MRAIKTSNATPIPTAAQIESVTLYTTPPGVTFFLTSCIGPILPARGQAPPACAKHRKIAALGWRALKWQAAEKSKPQKRRGKQRQRYRYIGEDHEPICQ